MDLVGPYCHYGGLMIPKEPSWFQRRPYRLSGFSGGLMAGLPASIGAFSLVWKPHGSPWRPCDAHNSLMVPVGALWLALAPVGA